MIYRALTINNWLNTKEQRAADCFQRLGNEGIKLCHKTTGDMLCSMEETVKFAFEGISFWDNFPNYCMNSFQEAGYVNCRNLESKITEHSPCFEATELKTHLAQGAQQTDGLDG